MILRNTLSSYIQTHIWYEFHLYYLLEHLLPICKKFTSLDGLLFTTNYRKHYSFWYFYQLVFKNKLLLLYKLKNKNSPQSSKIFLSIAYRNVHSI